MTKKKLSSIALATLLMLSMAAIFAVSPVLAAEPYIAMDPEHRVFNTPINGSTFTFDINVSSTVGFVGYQFYLFWNREYINATGWTESAPASFSFTAGIGLDWDYNATHGTIQRAAMDPGLTTITGTYTVATITFKIIDVPKQPDPDQLILIDLDAANTFLSDAGGNPFQCFVYDGDVFLKSAMAGLPTVWVEPYETYGTGVGAHFTVDIMIKDVEDAHQLWGWEFVMLYNTTHLDAVDVTEGPFLSSIAGTYMIAKFNGDWDPAEINVTYEDNEQNSLIRPGFGKIHAACLFVENHTNPTGGGVLATIEFEVTYMTPGDFPGIETSDLDITTSLADTDAWPGPPPGAIDHLTVDGIYHPPKEITEPRYIDCFTDAWRKYGSYYTEFTGKDIIQGIHQNADVYAPQDLVTLYANVTYFGDPVQNKPVQFEIYPRDKYTGEPREVEGFPLYRVALTNASGIAEITFRIPWPCDDPERVLGGWYCYQSVDIACMKVVDETWFEVAWPIELTKVMILNIDDIVYKYPTCTQYADINITFWNHALTDLPVYFTVVLYDHEMVPIGMIVIDRRQDKIPAGIWCHPHEDYIVTRIHIPKWAFIGQPNLIPGEDYWPFPAVYANAYTDRCSSCGQPYCPEVSDTYTLKTYAP